MATDLGVAPTEVGPRLREGIGMDRVPAARRVPEDRLPRDHGHLAQYDTLAWTTEWYLREDNLRAANAAIVDHHRLSLASVWGGGTVSSSDGQRFPMRGKSLPVFSPFNLTGVFPNAGKLLRGTVDTALIRSRWDEIPRLAASLKYGHAAASLVVGKLHAAFRRSALAQALGEFGGLQRTLYALRYLATRPTGAASPASSTMAGPCTPCAATCSSPTGSRCGAATTTSRPNRPCACPWR
ncbi:Tn3 family transposase [Saccharothrix sp. BKS2]